MKLERIIQSIQESLESADYREDSFRSDRASKKGLRKPPVCTVGTSCGFSCISKKLNCRKTPSDLTGSERQSLEKLKNLVSKRTPTRNALVRLSQERKINQAVQERLKNAGFNPSKVQSTLAELSPSDIEADPKRFQYKIIGEFTKTGEVGSLAEVRKWDENLGGILQVWKDPSDGKTYVVNGHNRLALAKKLGAEKVAVRYLQTETAEEARAIGALTNIAEGRGTALDAARFFRDTGLTKQDLDRKGIPMREKIATDGLALSQLEDELFRKTIDGELPIERAVVIGQSGLTGEKQRKLVELIDKRKSINNDVISELIDTVKSSESQSEIQFDLFGASTVEKNLAIEKASVQASIKRRLSREKKLFGTVGKTTSAKELSRGGNQIDVEKSATIASEADRIARAFDDLKNVKGLVSDKLNEAAQRINQGENAKKVQEEIYEEIRKAVGEELQKTFKTRKG